MNINIRHISRCHSELRKGEAHFGPVHVGCGGNTSRGGPRPQAAIGAGESHKGPRGERSVDTGKFDHVIGTDPADHVTRRDISVGIDEEHHAALTGNTLLWYSLKGSVLRSLEIEVRNRSGLSTGIGWLGRCNILRHVTGGWGHIRRIHLRHRIAREDIGGHASIEESASSLTHRIVRSDVEDQRLGGCGRGGVLVKGVPCVFTGKGCKSPVRKRSIYHNPGRCLENIEIHNRRQFRIGDARACLGRSESHTDGLASLRFRSIHRHGKVQHGIGLHVDGRINAHRYSVPVNHTGAYRLAVHKNRKRESRHIGRTGGDEMKGRKRGREG